MASDPRSGAVSPRWRVSGSESWAFRETNMMDYAINEASFGVTVAGCDR